MDSAAFSKARLSAQNRLTLSAAEEFVSAGAGKRKGWMRDAQGLWRGALEEAEVSEEDPWIQAQWSGGGSLWRSRSGEAEVVEEWSNDKIPYTEAGRAGKLFGFFGGQLASGGAADMMGVNARLGSTLLRNRYDMALILGYNSFDTDPKTSSVSYGDQLPGSRPSATTWVFKSCAPPLRGRGGPGRLGGRTSSWAAELRPHAERGQPQLLRPPGRIFLLLRDAEGRRRAVCENERMGRAFATSPRYVYNMNYQSI